MGYEAVIFFLLAVIAVMAIEWRRAVRENKTMVKALAGANIALSNSRTELESADKVNAELQAEILRLRKNPLTLKEDKEDNRVIKARSAAQVRNITESAFGIQPEIGKGN